MVPQLGSRSITRFHWISCIATSASCARTQKTLWRQVGIAISLRLSCDAAIDCSFSGVYNVGVICAISIHRTSGLASSARPRAKPSSTNHRSTSEWWWRTAGPVVHSLHVHRWAKKRCATATSGGGLDDGAEICEIFEMLDENGSGLCHCERDHPTLGSWARKD